MKTKKLKVQVWIFCRNPREGGIYFLVLLTLPQRGQFWQPVTGSVDDGESTEAAALREAQEESGLKFLGSPVRVGEPFEFESRGKQVREFGYLLEAQMDGGKLPKVVVDGHEHMDYRWVNSSEAAKMIAFPSNLQMLNLVLTKLHG